MGIFSIASIDTIKDGAESTLVRFAKEKAHLRYADIRLEISEERGAYCENGEEKYSGMDYGFSFGVRVLAGEDCTAPGYFGLILGEEGLPHFHSTLLEGLNHAYERALFSARWKSKAKNHFKKLGNTLSDITLAPVKICRDTLPAEYEINPLSVSPKTISRYIKDISKEIKLLDSSISYNQIAASTMLLREYFVSTEGASIDQTFAISHGIAYIVASGKEGVQEQYDDIGHQRGWEIIEQGHNGPLLYNKDLRAFSMDLARETLLLSNSPALQETENEVTIVTDPHFNTLLSHEIIGHPNELDRVLKMETAYAGRSWLFNNTQHNQLEKQVASPLVSTYSDPSLPGFGHYKYDHEGTPAKKAYHIKKGFLKDFINSRQTAAILNVEPNGSYKSTDASLVPLIRMSTTVFENGAQDAQEIIGEVDHGYYLVGHRIPSIAESRENFRITARKVYEIKNGQIGQLYRDGGITADSRDFLMQVDAVGNDFRVYPIPNCGKGQPMQTKKMGNGGPTLRSRARLTGTSS
jgi:TldD protein